MKNETKLSKILSRFKLVLGTGFFLLLLLFLGIFVINKSEITLGDYGGYIAGLIGTGISFVTVILVYNTYHLQEKELELQREELRETRNQLKKQQFETVFFKMLDNIYIIGRELKETGGHTKGFFVDFINDMKTHYPSNYTSRDFVMDSLLTEYVRKKLETRYPGEERFAPDSESTSYNIRTWSFESIENEEIYCGLLFEYLYKTKFETRSNHYFRYIYNTLKFVKDELKNEENIEYYTNLIQSQLSSHQQVILFYNCISDLGLNSSDQPLFKELVKKYDIVGRLDDQLLIRPRHRKFYD